jgi:hypothetical protein
MSPAELTVRDVLDRVHAEGASLRVDLRERRLYWHEMPPARALPAVNDLVAAHYEALVLELLPWRCPRCMGVAELPARECYRCSLALDAYAASGGRFAIGATVWHAVGIGGGEWPFCGLVKARPGSTVAGPIGDRARLCRLCLSHLHRLVRAERAR